MSMMMNNPLRTGKQFRATLANPNPKYRNNKTGKKYLVEFEIDKDVWELFDDASNLAGMYLAAVMQVAEAHSTKDTKEITESEKKEKSLSQQAYLLCQEPNFQEWAFNIWPHPDGVGAKSADTYIKLICHIDSKSELDTYKPAADAFKKIIKDFREWVQNEKG